MKRVRSCNATFSFPTKYHPVSYAVTKASQVSNRVKRITYITAIHLHANHYEDDLLRQYEIKPKIRRSNTHIRSGRMKQLLENRLGNIDLEYCKEILCDHANYPYSICGHNVAGEADSLTQSALVFIPEEKLMLASDGSACQ